MLEYLWDQAVSKPIETAALVVGLLALTVTIGFWKPLPKLVSLLAAHIKRGSSVIWTHCKSKVKSLYLSLYLRISTRAILWERQRIADFALQHAQKDYVPTTQFLFEMGQDGVTDEANITIRLMHANYKGRKEMSHLMLSFIDGERWPHDQENFWTEEVLMELHRPHQADSETPREGAGRYLEELRLQWIDSSKPGNERITTTFTTDSRRHMARKGTIAVRQYGTWFGYPYAIELNGDLITDPSSGEPLTFKTTLEAKLEAERQLGVDYPHYGP